MITDAVSPALSASTKATHAANTQVRYRLPDYAIALTAEALLRREDVEGLAGVARGLAHADPNHVDWIYTAVHNAFTVCASQRDSAVPLCDVLIEGADPELRRGAAQLRDVLIQITPVLRPAGDS